MDSNASGRSLLHPLALAAVATLVVNDHLLKAAFPGTLTGKLSDVAGLIFFPFVLLTAMELVRPRADRQRLIVAAIAVTLIGFVFVKATPVGAAAVGWSLGAAQWLVTLGPVRGATMAPAVVTVDPTDLFALPVLLVAWLIASPPRIQPPALTPRSRPSALALVALLLAGLASMATSQGAPSVGADFKADLHLTKDAPVALRHLDFSVTTGKDDLTSVTFTAGAYEHGHDGDIETLVPSTRVQLSIIPDAANVLIPTVDGYMTPALDLTALCVTGCQHGVMVLVRLGPNAPDDGVDIVLDASLWASGEFQEGGKTTIDTQAALTEDVAARLDGSPPSVSATVDGSIEVGTNDPEAVRRITLTVDREALTGPLEFPLAGRLAIKVELESAGGAPNAAEVTFSLPGDEAGRTLDLGAGPADVDWLAHCETGKDCSLTFDLGCSYQAWMNAPFADADADPDAPAPTETVPGYVRLHWTVEARLEAFDGRSLPRDALVLTMDPP